MNADFAVCTILAANYIAAARTLFVSLARHHPGTPCFALLVDDWREHLDPRRESFELMDIGTLPLPDLTRMRFQYDVTEFSTAVKPWLLDHLLRERRYRKVLYLDPDIYVTGNLEGVLHALDTASILLTPHLDKDFPDDGCHPDTGTMLQAGSYNLGFLGVRNTPMALDMLEWLRQKLTNHCMCEPERGYFVDQHFFDLVPSLWDEVTILHDVACNVAYWNLHSRVISRIGDQWHVNGGPLTFFHFSGFDANKPDILSKHQNRHVFGTRADLVPLFREYQQAVMKQGHASSRGWRYSPHFFDDGTRVHTELRRAYRSIPLLQRASVDPFHCLRLKWLNWLLESRYLHRGELTKWSCQRLLNEWLPDTDGHDSVLVRLVALYQRLLRLLADSQGRKRENALLRLKQRIGKRLLSTIERFVNEDPRTSRSALTVLLKHEPGAIFQRRFWPLAFRSFVWSWCRGGMLRLRRLWIPRF